MSELIETQAAIAWELSQSWGGRHVSEDCVYRYARRASDPLPVVIVMGRWQIPRRALLEWAAKQPRSPESRPSPLSPSL